MIDFTIIKFKSEDVAKKYEKDTSTLGVVLEKTNDVFTVLFFNVKNVGDYAVFDAPKSDFIATPYDLPQNVKEILAEYLTTRVEEITNKKNFVLQPFCDSDYVELTIDKSKYLKHGVKKGDKGIVIYERAVKNSILVDFSASAHEEKCISVDINDLKRV